MPFLQDYMDQVRAPRFGGYLYSQSPKDLGPVSQILGKNLQNSSAVVTRVLFHPFFICISSIYSYPLSPLLQCLFIITQE